MKSILSLKSVMILFLVLLEYYQVTAGWVLTGKYIDREGNTIMQRFFIQDNNLKYEQYNIIYTFNFNTNAIILVDPVNLVYYKGSIDSYIVGLKQFKSLQIRKLLNEIPETQKEYYLKKYSAEVEHIGHPIAPFLDSINIVKQSDSLKVFGKNTDKYQVLINNRKTEDIWISPLLDFGKQFNWGKYLYFLSVIEPEYPTLNYMTALPYQEILAGGFPVRRILVLGGYRIEYQINRKEEKTIPEYEFYTPALCKEVTFEQWMQRDKEIKYDDYE